MQGLPLFAARRRNFFLYIIAIALPLVFLATMLSQNVFAQNTFVITDGDQVIVHTTYASDPAMALDKAGVDVDPDEYYTTQSELVLQTSTNRHGGDSRYRQVSTYLHVWRIMHLIVGGISTQPSNHQLPQNVNRRHIHAYCF